MIEFSLPQGRALDRAREAFIDIEAAADLLSQAPAGIGRKRAAASAIYAAAADTGDYDADVEEELATNRHARRLHAAFVAQTAQFSFATLRAASSGNSSERHGDGCHIRIERSRAEPSQFFVVVHLLRETASDQSPTSLILCDREDHCRRFPIPALRNGIAQFIAEADSDLMRLMGDPTTKVLLG